MGLAASQARFLAITARKANCEFQSMQIAQEKLSVSNDLTKATQQYQNALNTTKLVWDADGTGEYMCDLSYELLMEPSDLNGYTPYLVTARNGQIALNARYAAAAREAGIDPNGGANGTLAGRDAFLDALVNHGLITKTTSDMLKLNGYSEAAGVGGAPLDKGTANAVSNGTLANILSDGQYNLGLFSKTSPGGTLIETLKADRGSGFGFNSSNRSGNSLLLTQNGGGALSSDAVLETLTIGELLNNNYVILMAGGDDENMNNESDGMATFVENVIGSAPMFEDNNSVFGRIVQALNEMLNLDEITNKAFEYAYAKILQMYSANNATSAGTPGSTSDSFNSANNKANSMNTIVYTKDDDLSKKENAHVAVSLSNMLSSFLTYFAQQLNSNTGYSVRKFVDNSFYVTDDMNFIYDLKSENAVTEKDLMMTDFYNSLYNNLCMNGWTEEYADKLSEDSYLDHALKNGQLFVSSLCTDGYYYQSPYSRTGFIVEVTDDDAITQAELEYQIVKSKLNYKEESLDVEMKNLDMEISSLTTEYDTVKNLISKNVEKIFTLFQ